MKTKIIMMLFLLSFAGLMAQDGGKFQDLKKKPEPVHLAKPVYPQEAIKAGLTGMVVLEVTIDEKGNPLKAVVVTENHEGAEGAKADNAVKAKLKDIFSQPSIDAAMKMKFSPGLDKNNKPVKSTVMIPFKYNLDNKKK